MGVEGRDIGLTRIELWRDLGISVSIVEPMIVTAYEREAEREWRGDGDRHTTSFYISNHPGDDPHACGRAAVYSLMDVPRDKPIDLRGYGYMDSGKAIEQAWTRRWAAQGMLLSADESAGERQTKFEDPDVWASGAVDAIVLPPFWRKGHVVEVKQTSHDKLVAMQDDPANTIYSHAKYSRQIREYIGLAHEQGWAPRVVVCDESWAITVEFPMGLRWCPAHRTFDCATQEVQLAPPDDGTLIYSSREEPNTAIVSYYFSYDPEFMATGREKLAEWRAHFEVGTLPPHPLDGERKMWSAPPCQYCAYKGNGKLDGCKADFAAKVTHLADSHWIESARGIRPGYDYEEQRERVFKRWGVPDPLREMATA